jgi:hypothetical protein
VASAAEAVRFLLANFPQVEKHMVDQHYRVSIGARALDAEELHEPAGCSDIAIVPVIGGAGAVGRIVAGVALVALSLLTAGATIGLLGLAAPFAISPILVGIGASLALGGVAQLLTPVPRMAGPGAASMGPMAKAADDNDPRKNYSFSGIQNTSRQGVPVPVIYGEAIVGSVVISAGIDVDQVAA